MLRAAAFLLAAVGAVQAAEPFIDITSADVLRLEGMRPVSALVRPDEAIVADAESGSVYRIARPSAGRRRIAGVRVDAQTRLAPAPGGEWYLLDPPARLLVRFSREGAVLERMRDDLLLRNTTGLAYEPKSGSVALTARPVQSVDPTLLARYGLSPWPKLEANQVGNLVRFRGEAVAVRHGETYILSTDAQAVFMVTRDRPDPARIPIDVARGPGSMAVDALGRIYLADGSVIRVYEGSRSVGTVDFARFGLAAITEVRADDNRLSVIDATAAAIVSAAIAPPR